MSRCIGLIGFGAIGAEVAADLAASKDQDFDLVVLLRPGSPRLSKLPQGATAVHDLPSLLTFKPDLIVEAAGAEAAKNLAPACLGAGIPTLVSSIGVLADDTVLAALTQAARGSGAKLLLPSGAVGALDYLSAVRRIPGTQVTYESRKPPAAWADELAARGLDPKTLSEPLTLFSGPAREAARLYPKNLNVAATLALAGIGMEGTQVAVVVDPAASGNIHTIRVEGPAGRLEATIANRPSPTNPKTSWVVSKSIVATIDKFFAPVVIG